MGGALPCETTDVIPAVQDDYYPDEAYPATGYSEAYDYVEDRAEDVRPFVGVNADTDQFPMPVLDNPHAPEEQTLLAPIDVAKMDAERAAAERAAAEAPTVQTPSCDDTPSREIYIRELLRREGKLPREQRRKQAPKIAAAAAGVAALCGAVAASIVHVQQADNNQNTANGSGVPLTVVDGGGRPHGQALDAPLAPRGTEQVTPDNGTAGTSTDKQAPKPRVAPYVTASQQAQQNSSSSTPPTTTTNPPSSSTSTDPTSPNTTSPSQTPNNPPPTSSSNSAATGGSHGNSTPPASTTEDKGLLNGLLDPITGLLG
ncbi:hypothetical protein [Kutzneria chonburiensis]|uniref:hypothetical protein n=1 Tax=Kutzneria chonburiensis TaxID=1483604 RepID=UPI00235FE94B|nr:hypothetical protein [Kutzneria chonburiensis]